MRQWMKYLVIGWSIVCIGIILITFQIMKKGFIKEDYLIKLRPCEQNRKILTLDEYERILAAEEALRDPEFHALPIEEQRKVLNSIDPEGIEIDYQYDIDEVFFLLFPIYSFLVWLIPILVFSLLGVLFSKRMKTE